MIRRLVSCRLLSTKKGNTATFEFPEAFKTYLCDSPPTTTSVSKDDLLKYYKTMSTVRRMEIMADTLYKQRMIRGFCHLYDGQEAVAVGMEAALTFDDYVITAYREHGWQYTRGDSIESVFAELMGKKTGCARGKGGSMHMYFPQHKFFGGNGIVGAQVPLGAGLAFAAKYKKEKAVAVALYGDGAANQGQIFEAANMASLWDLPMIFVCENNQYGMGTSVDRASAEREFYKRGQYIAGIQVDGMDVLAVRSATEYAVNWCRSGKGPMFMEMKTYRYHGHSMSDPGITYRTRDEVTNVRNTRDCIAKVKGRLLDEGWATEDSLKALDKEIRAEVDDAIAKAKAAEELTPDEMFTDIYNKALPPFVRFPDFGKSKSFV